MMKTDSWLSNSICVSVFFFSPLFALLLSLPPLSLFSKSSRLYECTLHTRSQKREREIVLIFEAWWKLSHRPFVAMIWLYRWKEYFIINRWLSSDCNKRERERETWVTASRPRGREGGWRGGTSINLKLKLLSTGFSFSCLADSHKQQSLSKVVAKFFSTLHSRAAVTCAKLIRRSVCEEEKKKWTKRHSLNPANHSLCEQESNVLFISSFTLSSECDYQSTHLSSNSCTVSSTGLTVTLTFTLHAVLSRPSLIVSRNPLRRERAT